jgi:hypothetical protein
MNRRAMAGGLALATVALLPVGASTAVAEDNPYSVTFESPSSLTIEYGQSWQFKATGRPTAIGVGETYGGRAEMRSGTGAYTPNAYSAYYGSPEYKTEIYIHSEYEKPPLPVGTYMIDAILTATFFETGDLAKSTTPATLKVEPAKLGIELRVLADPDNSDAAVVTVRFTGRFVDEYQSSFFPGAAVSPAGTWSITLKDAAGEVAVQQSVERAAGDDVLATSFYWPDAEPGENYTATAEFTPNGSSASNFSITPAASFSYTAPEQLRPTPTSTATAKPDASLPEATGFGLPLWTLILAIVLILGLGALVTILSVRLNRRPSTTAEEVSE